MKALQVIIKYLNILSKRRKQIVIMEWVKLYQKAISESITLNDKNREQYEVYNTTCPSCRSRKVVDRILALARDSWPYRDAQVISHCSDCGRDWERVESRCVTSISRIEIWLYCLPELFASSSSNSREKQAHSIFDGVHAETIRYIYKQCHFEGKRVRLKELRKLFKSVYD